MIVFSMAVTAITVIVVMVAGHDGDCCEVFPARRESKL